MMRDNSWGFVRVNALANGYWASCALHAAVRTGLSGELAKGPRTTDDLAQGLELDSRAVGMLLTVFTTLGLLNKDGEVYSMVPEAAPFFLPGGPKDMSHIIMHNALMVETWAKLHNSMQSGNPVNPGFTPKESLHFYKGMRDISRQQAGGLAARLGLKSGQSLLDLGGGPGIYGYTFAQETSGLRVTVFDLPDSLPSFEEEAQGRDLSIPVTRINGDYTIDHIGGPYDVIWISHILHGEGPDAAGALLKKAAAALNPGGALWIQEFVVDPEGKGHPFAALFALNMLLNTEKGQAYSFKELSDLMTAAGLENIQAVGPTAPGAPASLIKGEKPK
jgi:2-polyprenyl-3-methyl-5-hydroxy-6-metoxy-1,4-benzoquinol methylase